MQIPSAWSFIVCGERYQPATTGTRLCLEGGRSPGVGRDNWFWEIFSEKRRGPGQASTPPMSPTRAAGVSERTAGTSLFKTLTQSKATADHAAFALTGDASKSNRVLLTHRIMADGSCSRARLPERYQPAMRLAGATRAQARGVTDGRIGSDGWLGEIIIS